MENEIRDRWNDILNYLKNEYNIPNVAYNTWLLNLKPHSVDEENNVITISIDDNNIGKNSKDYIKDKYGIFLQVSIEVITGYHLTIIYVNKSEVEKHLPEEKDEPENNNNNYSMDLNDKYTFDTFIVGSNNSMAHAAALAVAESPFNNPYNPLFIYGGSGLGKTHLVHSIAHYIMEHSPELNVLYVTSEEYTNEIVNAMRNSKQDMTLLNIIKKKYREVDILIIDDIQFIIGKTATQEEFFHTFNTLYEQGKQIILTSDKHPNKMELLDERYRTRFTSGIPVDITSPDYETRLSILMNKNDESDVKLNNDVIKFIAENIKTNIRDLEGAYNKVILRSKLQRCDITIDIAKEDLKDMILTDDNVKITNDYIINIVIERYKERYNVTLEDLTSKNRTKNIAHVRMICMYLCKKITNSTYEEIGYKLGNRDRTTILHGFEKIEEQLRTDVTLQNEIETLMKIINHQ